MGSGPGFSASWIHAGTGCSSDGFFMCGDLLFKLEGAVSGTLMDLGPGYKLTLDESVVTATPQAAGPVGTWQLRFEAGMVQTVQAGGGVLDPSVVGSFDYSLECIAGCAGDPLEHDGTFYFFSNIFGPAGPPPDPNSPNQLFPDHLVLWGNNWDKSAGGPPNENRLGVDLTGPIRPVPEPDSLLLVGSGLLLGVGFLKRKLNRSS